LKVTSTWSALAIECSAVFVVAFGSLQAMATLLKVIARGQAGEIEGRQIWLKFATWILLALEFALAADIVRTAVAPTWEDITKLAVIAIVRTMLNYFLAKDISTFDQSGPSRQTAYLPTAAGGMNQLSASLAIALNLRHGSDS
jgi:uncharacterized membrane protein